MYLAAQYDRLKTLKPARWYLTRAFLTIKAMYYQASWYSHQADRSPRRASRRMS